MTIITDTDDVIELSDHEEVNKHLNDGWVLLAVHPNTKPSKESPHLNVYVLASTPLAAEIKDMIEIAEINIDEFQSKLDEGYVLLKVVENHDKELNDVYPAIYVMGKPINKGAKYTNSLR